MRLLITINLGNEAMQTADDVRDAVDASTARSATTTATPSASGG